MKQRMWDHITKKKRVHRWVLWDLSNGPDGGTKKRFTYYAWVYRTRVAARKQYHIHKARPEFTELTYPEKLPTSVVNARYAPVPDCVDPHYFYRKADRIPM